MESLSELFNLLERIIEHTVNNIGIYLCKLDKTAIKHFRKKPEKR
jgi:hypothetical protein